MSERERKNLDKQTVEKKKNKKTRERPGELVGRQHEQSCEGKTQLLHRLSIDRIDRLDSEAGVCVPPRPSWIQQRTMQDADGGASVSAHAAKRCLSS